MMKNILDRLNKMSESDNNTERWIANGIAIILGLSILFLIYFSLRCA